MLDVTSRVARETSNIIVKLFKSSCSMKLNAGDSIPFPAPTAPPIPKIRMVTVSYTHLTLPTNREV